MKTTTKPLGCGRRSHRHQAFASAQGHRGARVISLRKPASTAQQEEERAREERLARQAEFARVGENASEAAIGRLNELDRGLL